MQRLLISLIVLTSVRAAADERVMLEYVPGSVANPLKGLVPYASDTNLSFPHSMEFNYLGFADLVKGYEEFDWRRNPTGSWGQSIRCTDRQLKHPGLPQVRRPDTCLMADGIAAWRHRLRVEGSGRS